MTPCSWANSPRRFKTIVVPSCSETSSVTSQKAWVDSNLAANTSVSPHDHYWDVPFFISVWRAIPLVVTRPLHLPEAWGQSQDSLCGIYGGQSGTGMWYSLSTSAPSWWLQLHQCIEPSVGPGNGQWVSEGRQLNSDTALCNRWS
jgi:hypothetical protein